MRTKRKYIGLGFRIPHSAFGILHSAFRIRLVLLAGIAVGGQNDIRVGQLSGGERQSLEALQALSVPSLAAIAEDTSPGRIETRTAELLASDSLAIGSRGVDTNSQSRIHRLIHRSISDLAPHGIKPLGSLKDTIAVPVRLELAQRAIRAGEVSRIEMGGETHRVWPVWPNGSMPSLCPEGGISGTLVYVGNADWRALKGLDLKGAIALMDFAGGRNWERLFMLGARAVVVLEDQHVNRHNAVALFCNTPIPFPRFYVERRTANALLARAVRKGSSGRAAEGATGRLFGGSVYENRPIESIFAYLPPTDPGRFEVKPTSLIERIAAEVGCSVDDLMRQNGLESPELKSGQSLDIPGRLDPYVVPPADLLRRLAREYGMSPEALAYGGGLVPALPDAGAVLPELLPGSQLTVPNINETLFISVRIDSVSAVPDLPHGASVAGNIVAALTTMEHLATSEDVARRKGVLFAFLDGDNHGGRASRAFAESLALDGGEWRSTANQKDHQASGTSRLVSYREALAWLSGGDAAMLSEETAEWLATEWMATRFETVRVSLAEARIAPIQQRNNARASQSEVQSARELLASLDARINVIREVRDSTFGDGRVGAAQRLDGFLALVRGDVYRQRLHELGLGTDALERRLREEYEEENLDHEIRRNNIAVSRAIVDILHPEEDDYQSRGQRPVLGLHFDLSDGSATLRCDATADGRAVALPGAGFSKGNESRFFNVTAFASVRGGWDEEWTYMGNSPRADFNEVKLPERPYTYAEFLAGGRIASAWLSTINDLRARLDTPEDTVENMAFAKLAVNVRTALLLIKTGVESPADSDADKAMKPTQYGRLVGSAVKFNIRSGIDAQDPVPGVYVYYPGLPKSTAPGAYARNSAACLGGRPGIMMISKLSGAFSTPIEAMRFHTRDSTPYVYASLLNERTGVFGMLMDQASIGTQKQTPRFSLAAGRDSEKRLVLTPLYPLAMFSGVDPMEYADIPSPGSGVASLELKDAVLNGAPRHYAAETAGLNYRELDVSSVLVYAPAGRRVRLTVDDKGTTKMALVGKLGDDPEGRGNGYLVGPEGDDPNLAVTMTPLRIAQDLYQKADRRRREFKSFGIRDSEVDRAIKRSGEKLAEAEDLAAQRDWQSAVGAARESWGILVKNYPTILRMGREAVFSVVFLMALLVSFSSFMERLMIGSKSIIARLIGASAIFCVATLYLNLVHPAFKISVSPFIVMVAFVMILMSSFVLGLCYQRFDVLVRRARIAGGEVESEEISLASSLATAFSLGVSNLKKRPSRTILTAFTVSVLTFSIITFVSVSGENALMRQSVALECSIEGVAVDSIPPAYEGVMFRQFNWSALKDGMVSAIRTEYGREFDVVARAHWIEVEGGNNADREGVNQVELSFAGRQTVINGIMAFEPSEPAFSGINRAVTSDLWFQGRESAGGSTGDRFHVIIPDTAARTLGITAEDILDAGGARRPDAELPLVRMLNSDWRVVGILDTASANCIRDVNGKSLSMVDYVRSGVTPSTGRGNLESEGVTYHMGWDRLAIVPMAARQDVGAAWRSMAIKFRPGTDVDAFLRDVALRKRSAMFANIGGQVSLVSAKKARSVGGLAKIVVPIILCILIVANTMLGTVEERRGEVEMLGAVGLSPRQIAFLLLSEATVFSVLGIIFGVFCGLGFSKVMLFYPGAFGGMSVNFTSLASTWLAMSTGLIVLLATLVPAKRAAAMAAPSGMEKWKLPAPGPDGTIDFVLPFTLTRGNAVGMIAFFRRFMLNHTESTSADFNCRDIRASVQTEGGDRLELTAHMWLAPYDLDVAQRMALHILPSRNEGVFHARIVLHRTSGTEEAWLRTNYSYMDLVRLQFLLWRNLDVKQRRTYIEEGKNVLSTERGLANAGRQTAGS